MYEFLIGVSDSQTNRAVLVLVIFLHLARTTQKKMLTLLLLPSTNTKDAFKQHVKKSEGVLFNFRSDGIKHALRSLRNDAFRSEKSTPGWEKSEGQLIPWLKKKRKTCTVSYFATFCNSRASMLRCWRHLQAPRFASPPGPHRRRTARSGGRPGAMWGTQDLIRKQMIRYRYLIPDIHIYLIYSDILDIQIWLENRYILI